MPPMPFCLPPPYHMAPEHWVGRQWTVRNGMVGVGKKHPSHGTACPPMPVPLSPSVLHSRWRLLWTVSVLPGRTSCLPAHPPPSTAPSRYMPSTHATAVPARPSGRGTFSYALYSPVLDGFIFSSNQWFEGSHPLVCHRTLRWVYLTA